MFESLTDKLQRVFKNLRGQGKLSEEHLDEALAGLAASAHAQAEELAAGFRGNEHQGRPDAEWRFEVADVRIVAGPPERGRENQGA